MNYSTVTTLEEEEINDRDYLNKTIPDNYENVISSHKTFATESIPLSKESSTHRYSEEIINSVEGVILTVDENSVRVKFPPSTYMRLPKELFNDQRTTTEGQKIRYILKKDTDGYRYPSVVTIGETVAEEKIKPVLDILSKIKYRDV